MMKNKNKQQQKKILIHKDSAVVINGRDPESNFGVVNPPVYHASTIIYPTVAALNEGIKTPFTGTRYGRRGTPTTFALEEAITELEGGYRTIAVASGLNAITTTLLALLENGDHLLMVDSVYGPTRAFCNSVLKKMGIETTYYDPCIGKEMAELFQSNTKLVFCETPGSHTFEIQDMDLISSLAREHGARVVADNTWAAGYYYRPLEHGADVSLQAATKYIVGHSDAMMGTITCNEEMFLKVKRMSALLGVHAAPDDCYLAGRGLRTLAVRLARHNTSALDIANWLLEQDEIETVLHPALPTCPGHDIWKRDFTGSSGLFSFVLKPGYSDDDLARMLDGMELFAMGFSWGGFESLIIPGEGKTHRTVYLPGFKGTPLRVHIGLEDVDDLKADLKAGLERLKN